MFRNNIIARSVQFSIYLTLLEMKTGLNRKGVARGVLNLIPVRKMAGQRALSMSGHCERTVLTLCLKFHFNCDNRVEKWFVCE